MTVYERIIDRQAKIAIIGLGYVGMPLAVAFAKKVQVIGYDINEKKIDLYKQGIDPTQEVGHEELLKADIIFTSDERKLAEARFHIIAVPTPINLDKTPNLSPVEYASIIVGRNLVKDSIVVYESTVYPGVTEDVCIPLLERESGLKCGIDFKVGYSPERINPGDKLHKLENIVKIVAGIDEDCLENIMKIYQLIINAGIHKVSSVKVAEAAKVVENSQRDINIAFMNELAMVFDKMGIDTNEVVDAMNSKWNALGFRPGLVGGHCIGIDPYYFIYEAEKLGYHSQIIAAGRKINDGMGQYIADIAIKHMILANKTIKQAKIVIFGLTFKENCPDIRNSKVIDIIKRLNEYEVYPTITDAYADLNEAQSEYGIILTDLDNIHNADCIIFAVAHNDYREMNWSQIDKYFIHCDNSEKVIIDVKGMLNINELKDRGYAFWRL